MYNVGYWVLRVFWLARWKDRQEVIRQTWKKAWLMYRPSAIKRGRVPSTRQGCQDRDMCGSTTDEDHRQGYRTEKLKHTSLERSEQQKQADDQQVISERMLGWWHAWQKSTRKIKAGLTDLNCKEPTLPKGFDREARNLMQRLCPRKSGPHQAVSHCSGTQNSVSISISSAPGKTDHGKPVREENETVSMMERRKWKKTVKTRCSSTWRYRLSMKWQESEGWSCKKGKPWGGFSICTKLWVVQKKHRCEQLGHAERRRGNVGGATAHQSTVPAHIITLHDLSLN